MRRTRFYNLLTLLFTLLTLSVIGIMAAAATDYLRLPGQAVRTDDLVPTLFQPPAALQPWTPPDTAPQAVAQAQPAAAPADTHETAAGSPGEALAEAPAAPVAQAAEDVPVPPVAQPVESQAAAPAAPVAQAAEDVAAPQEAPPVEPQVVAPAALIEQQNAPAAPAAPPASSAPVPPQVPPENPAPANAAQRSELRLPEPTPVPGQAPTPAPPGGRESPLRVMVPSDPVAQQIQAQGLTIFDLFPAMDPALSFAPGPRMNLPHFATTGREAQDAPASPFKMLAILVQFSDNATSTTATFFDTKVFGTSSNTVRGYYREVSYNQLDIVAVTLPSTLGWQTAPQTYAYYAGNSVPGDDRGYCLDAAYPNNCRRMAEDLANQVNALVDFSQYDNDGDGWVDTLMIVHAGSGAEWTGDEGDMWSHSWWTVNPPNLDGKFVGNYIVMPEFWNTSGDITHGVYVHELGHAFGLPDFYDVDYTSKGVGNWSLMSGGSWNGSMGGTPAHLDAWSRLYLEFNTATDVSVTGGIITLPNVEQNQVGSIYRFNSPSADEYWLIENRQKLLSDTALPGAGLLIWHVDDDHSISYNRYECKQVLNYNCPADTQHFWLALEQADGLLDLEYNRGDGGDTGDPFPGSTGKTVFNFTSNPNTTSYFSTNQPTAGVSSISPSGSTMTAQIVIFVPAPAAPALVSPADASATNDTTPYFDWNSVQYGSTYRIQIDTNNDFSSPEQDVTGASTDFTSAALPDGKTYYWRVRAINVNGQNGPWSASRSLKVDALPPGLPGLVAPLDRTNIKDTTPQFDWTSPGGTILYQLQVSANPNLSAPVIDTQTSAVTYTAPTALPYGTYYWRVRSQDKAGNWGGWSVTYTVTITLLSTPTNATHLTAIPTFTWKSGDGADAYEFRLDNESSFSLPLVIGPINTGLTRTYTPGISLADGQYFWSVRVYDNGVWSGWMPAWTITMTAPPPAKPVLTAPTLGEPLSTPTPLFTWQAVSGGASFTYQIQIDNNDTFVSPLLDSTLPAGQLTHTPAAPLTEGGPLYWRVRAINLAGVAGKWASSSFKLLQLPAPTQSTPAADSKSSDTTPDFAWSGVPDAASYQLQVATDTTFVTLVHTVTQSETTYPLPGGSALPGGTYYWRVRAISAANVVGKWSTKWAFTVDLTPPTAPLLLSPVDHAGTNDFTPLFTWSLPAGAKAYQFQISPNADFSGAPVIPVATTQYDQPTDLGYGLYYWRVQARDLYNNWSEWSTANTLSVTILKAPADGSSTTLARPVFKWKAATGALYYEFQLDNDSNFGSTLASVNVGSALTYTPGFDLTPGAFYWRVRLNGGVWMPAWTVIVTPTTPGTPLLVAPASDGLTNDSTPLFSWEAATNGNTYRIQIDDAADFGGPEQDVTVGVGLLTYTASTLADGAYNWRVQAINSAGRAGAWSAGRKVTIDTTVPGAPVLIFPVNLASVTNPKLTFTWNEMKGATQYEIQLDPSNLFPLPAINTRDVESYTPPTPLSRLLYYWRVRAIDGAGNVSAWSEIRSFNLVAGVTVPSGDVPTATVAPPTETNGIVPTPTVLPTLTPTPTAVPLPALLPYIEGFDSGLGWIALGAWRSDAGAQGLGWFADASPRGMSSTLSGITPLDLRTAANPELTYWTRAVLSTADLVALDLSLDGGLTWLPLDQQIGAAWDWTSRTVNLSAYRGFVVTLRFRLDAFGAVPEGATSTGWWIDSLTVQEAPVVPTATPTDLPTATPVPTDPPTATPEPPTATPIPTDPPTATPIPTEPPAVEPTVIPENAEGSGS